MDQRGTPWIPNMHRVLSFLIHIIRMEGNLRISTPVWISGEMSRERVAVQASENAYSEFHAPRFRH